MGLVDYRREYNLWLDLIHNLVSMVIDPRPSTPSETSNTDPTFLFAAYLRWMGLYLLQIL